MEDLAVVAFGCLLHDIGKIVQRADDTPLRHGHARFGADLLQSAGLLKESKYWYHIFECIRYHHWKYIKDGSTTLPAARIAFEANSILSDASSGAVCDGDGFSLEEADFGGEAHWDRHRRLDSIFALMQQAGGREQVKASFPLAILEGRKISLSRCPFPEESPTEERAPECYSHLRDLAISPVVAYLQGRDPRSLELVNDVSSYLEHHLCFVPAESVAERACYISLFDHLKLTSAFGSCLYAWLSEQHPESFSQEGKALPDHQTLNTAPVYLLLFAELHGARHFILDSRDSSIAKLRARGLYIDLLRQWMSEQILRALGLSRNNLLLSAGNRFALVAPNTALGLATLARMQARLNEWLFERFAGRLYIALDCSEATASDLQNAPADKSQSRSVLRSAREKVHRVANEPFRGLLSAVFASQERTESCSRCSLDALPISRSFGGEGLCAYCAATAEIESSLEDVEAMISRPYLISGAPGGGVFPIWNSEIGKFQSGVLSLKNEPASLSAPQTSARSSRRGKRRETGSFAVLRARLVYPGGALEPGASGSRRSFIKDSLIEKSIERFLELQIDELLSEKDSRQFEYVERIICSPVEMLFGGPAERLIDFAIQLQQRLYKFTSGTVTLTCGVATSRQAASGKIFLQLAARAEELDGTAGNGMSVDFDTAGRQPGLAALSWHDWRREVRPLMHDLQRLRSRGGTSFWNQLLEFTLSKDSSFYRLLYAVARMDERFPDLRNDAIWQRFKRQRIMPMGSRAGDLRSKQMLAAALLWVELPSATFHRPGSHSPREDAAREPTREQAAEPVVQGAEGMSTQSEPDSTPVGGG